MIVNSVDVKGMGTRQLIDLAIAKSREVNTAKADLDILNAEIQTRAEQTLEERNVKFTELFGDTGYSAVTVAQSLEILNFFKLKELLGKEFVEDKIRPKAQEQKYEVDKNFARAMTAIITNDYDRTATVREVLDGLDLTPEQKILALKKLKGDYAKDKKVLLSILGKKDGEVDLDVELYMIYKAKNWELIRAYVDEDEFDALAEKIRRCVIVNETPRIGLKQYL